MRKSLPLLFFTFLTFIASAQLVITEISYNPPESGTDSLEYIELYNETAAEIDLTNYIIRDNSSHTIMGGVVPANGYAILAINPRAIMSVLGVEAIQIENIALSNGGEGIFLLNPNEVLIDEVFYDDNEPWPTFEDGTDGAGATVELCDIESDNNDASNWGVATNDLGVTVGGIPFLGTPGMPNTATCEFVPDHVVTVSSNVFTPADITIQVGESIRWVNTGGFHNVNGSLDVYPDNPEGFSNGAASGDSWIYDFTFTIPGVYDYQCDPHVGFGMVGTVTVEGDVEPETPTYDIGLINTTNADGVADSIGTRCIIEGVTHGANLRAGGLQFALIDDSGDAIGLFSGGNLGYTYQEGDLIRATGVITQFFGLVQIEADALEVVSTGNDLTGPILVGRLDESTESRLVTIEGLSINDPADWDNSDGDFNVSFTSEDGEVINLRIDADTEVADWDEGPVEGTWNITGIGGQFDDEVPLNSGYQLFPRYIADFDMVSSLDEQLDVDVTLYPNPARDILNIKVVGEVDEFVLYDGLGTIVQNGPYRSTLDISELSSGYYLIVLKKGDQKKITTFVKE